MMYRVSFLNELLPGSNRWLADDKHASTVDPMEIPSRIMAILLHGKGYIHVASFSFFDQCNGS